MTREAETGGSTQTHEAARYYRDRATAHRMMADNAIDPAVRTVHHQLADRYEASANGGKAGLRMVRSC